MPNNPELGLEGVFKTDAFQKGISTYTKSIGSATTLTKTASSAMAAGSTGGMSMMTGAVAGLVGGIAAGLIPAIIGLLDKLGEMVGSLIQVGKEALMAASRLEQLTLIAYTLGARMGKTRDEIDKEIDSIRKIGISATTATNTVAQFTKNQLDLADAAKLAAVAQDAATLSDRNSSEALQILIESILTGDSVMLRNMYLNIDLTAASRELEQQLGKTASQFTTSEQQQVRINAILKEGVKIQGAYAASMKTAGKQIGTLQGRLIPDLMAALGAPFQQAFYKVILTINQLVEAFTKMISKGGELYPLMITLGAAASMLADIWVGAWKLIWHIFSFFVGGFEKDSTKIEGAMTKAGKAVDKFATDTQYKLVDTVFKALTWGFNFATNLATGIIRGASTAIVTAINYITSLLTFWFSPGSPPRVAPELDIWGESAMNEFLKGMTTADFGILEGIQGPLLSAMDIMLQMGMIKGDELVDLYMGITEKIAAAMELFNETGAIDASIFDDIIAAGGPLGDELANLFYLQLQATQAAKEAKRAEDALAAAKIAASNAGKKVNQGLLEYNQMLRSGASKEALANKLKEINANKAEQKQAEDNITLESEKLRIAKEAQQQIQDQLAQQQAMIQQMIALIQLQEKYKEQPVPEQPAPPGGGGAPEPPGGGGGGPGIDIPLPDLGTAIGDAIDALIADIKARWARMWQDVWTEIAGAVITAVASARQAIMDLFQGIAEIGPALWGSIGTWLIDTSAKIGTWITDTGAKIGTWYIETGAKFGQWVIDRGADLGNWITTSTAAIGTWYTNTGAKIGEWVTSTGAQFGAWVTSRGADLGAWLTTNSAAVGTWVTDTGTKIGTWVTDTGTKFAAWITERGADLGVWLVDTTAKIGTWATDTGASIGTWVTDTGAKFGAWVSERINKDLGVWITDTTAEIGTWVTETTANFGTWSKDTGENISTWVTDRVADLGGWITDSATNISDWVTDTTSYVGTWATDTGSKIGTWVTDRSADLGPWITQSAADIGTWVTDTTAKIGTWYTDTGSKIGTWVTDRSADYGAWITESTAAIGTWYTDTTEKIGGFVTEGGSKLGQFYIDAGAGWSEFWMGVRTNFMDTFSGPGGIIGVLGGFVSSMVTGGAQLIQGLIDGITSMIGPAIQSVISAAQGIIDAALGVLGIESPSKIFKDMGMETIEGFSIGISKEAKALPAMLEKNLQPMIDVPKQMTREISTRNPAPTTNNYYNEFQLGGNQINTGMQVAQLEALILRTVKKGYVS